jgi:hypothetical protein
MRCSVLAPTLVVALLAGQAFGAEPTPTWVLFQDKGISAEDIPAALAQRKVTLAPRAVARRQRARGDAGATFTLPSGAFQELYANAVSGSVPLAAGTGLVLLDTGGPRC